MTVDEFITANEPRAGGEAFQLENDKLLDVTVDGTVIAKTGSMIAYSGDSSFAGSRPPRAASRGS